MNKTYRDIAKNLNIGQGTAYRIFSRFKLTGNIYSLQRNKSQQRKLNSRSELFVVGLVLEDPTMYLGEICHEIFQTLQIINIACLPIA